MSPCPGRPHAIDLLRGELAPAEADEARRHLMACEACAQEAVSVGELRALLERTPRVDPSRAFVGKVLAAVEGEKVVRRSAWRLWASRPGPAWGISFAFHAAAFAILAFLFYAQIKERPGDGPKPLPGPAAPAPAVEPEHAEWFDWERRDSIRAETPELVRAAIRRGIEWLEAAAVTPTPKISALVVLVESAEGVRIQKSRWLPERGDSDAPRVDRFGRLQDARPVAIRCLAALEEFRVGPPGAGANPAPEAAGLVGHVLYEESADGWWSGGSIAEGTGWAVLALRVADSLGMHFVHEQLSRSYQRLARTVERNVVRSLVVGGDPYDHPETEEQAFLAVLGGASVSLVLERQCPDGSWGGDAERTLYAVLALQAPYLYPPPIDRPER